ncbi:phosphotransferase enzyme family protein [Cystoisospora suis]|uniref:ethanolamine kinase n=1 Tax=Cystoisospora suis TaxID=483139 RepID=A0A2C6K6Z9_9APIC|nr:phosphotransferase enzyme family protein [Cystoisospora suis]
MVQQAPRIARELARLHTIDITGHYPPPSGGSSPAASSGSSSSSPCHPEGSRSRDEHVAGEKDTKEKAGGSQKVQSDLWITTWKLLQLCKEQQESARKVVQSGRSVCSDDIPGSRGPDGSPLTPFFRRILMFDLRSIEELLRRLQTLAMEVDSPIVLCHGDLLCGNIIKTDEGDICFIDFEYAGFMERGFDIANHFAEHAGIECDYTKCPDEAHQDAFLMEYLREARRLRRSATSHRQQADNGESASSSFTSSSLHRTTEDDRDFSSAPDRQQGHQKRRKDEDQDTDKEQQGTSLKTSCEEREKEDEEDLKKEFRALKREVQVFFSVSHVMWGLWGLVQAVHVLPREYNFWRFAFDRLAAAISPPIPSLAPPSLGPTAPSLSGGNDKE